MVNIKFYCDQLAKDLEFGDNGFEEISAGVFELYIAENTSIKVNSLGEGFSLSSILADCPTELVENFYKEVLHANLYGFITRNCNLGLSEDGTKLTLSRNINYPADYKEFSEILQDFYNIALLWRDLALNNLKVVK